MLLFHEGTPPAAPPPLPGQHGSRAEGSQLVTNPEPISGRSSYDLLGSQTPTPGPLNLTADEQGILRQVAADPKGDLKAAWSRIHAARAAAQACEPVDPTKPADAAQQAQESDSNILSDAVLRERSGGAASLALIEPMFELGHAFSARLDHAWQHGGEEAFGQAIEAGLSEIREREFAGSAERMNEAFGMIDKAAQILDPSGGLLKALNESGCLADHQIFRRAHLLAASVFNKCRRPA